MAVDAETITAGRASEILSEWHDGRRDVGFELFLGKWALMVEARGTLTGLGQSMHTFCSGETKYTFSPSKFREIALEVRGSEMSIKFRHPEGVENFDLMLLVFVPATVRPLPSITQMIQ